jgi:hypothetical protein
MHIINAESCFKDYLRKTRCCSETVLTGESRFYTSTPLGFEPGSLMTGSKRVVNWTSETWCEGNEVAGSPHCHLYLRRVNDS